MAVSILITRVASIILVHTGLSQPSARFQARSAFTGAGFTTNEAENVVNHPVRRKVIMMLMLLGNAGVVSAIASLLLTFVNGQENQMPLGFKIGILLGSVILLYSFASSRIVDRWLRKIVAKLLKKYTRLNVRDYSGLLHLSGEYEISELQVRKYGWMSNRSLRQLKLREEGINVLGIVRANGEYIGSPSSESKPHEGDILIVYGREGVVKSLNERKFGVPGAHDHLKAVKEQQEKEKEEQETVDRKQNDSSE